MSVISHPDLLLDVVSAGQALTAARIEQERGRRAVDVALRALLEAERNAHDAGVAYDEVEITAWRVLESITPEDFIRDSAPDSRTEAVLCVLAQVPALAQLPREHRLWIGAEILAAADTGI